MTICTRLKLGFVSDTENLSKDGESLPRERLYTLYRTALKKKYRHASQVSKQTLNDPDWAIGGDSPVSDKDTA